MKVVVLGAGIGGLSVACRLRHMGFEVDVIEKNSNPGGKASSLSFDGYTFDAGPSLFTYPNWLDDVFVFCDKNPREYYDYLKLKLVTRYFFNDQSYFDVFDNLQDTAKAIELNTNYSAAKFIDHIKYWNKVYELSEKTFLSGKIKFNLSFLKAALTWFFQIGLRPIFSSMASFNKRVINNKKVELLLNRFATYTGSSPFKTPAFMNQLAVVEIAKGAYYPKNGIYSIPKALEQLALDLGVSFSYDQQVEAIRKTNKKWEIRTENSSTLADLIVSNIDYTFTQHLLGRKFSLSTAQLATSGVVFYWGITAQFDQLQLHNVFFSTDYLKEFRQIFDDEVFPDQPTVYVNVSAKMDKLHAKKGCENWFVMVNVPAKLSLANELTLSKLKEAVVKLLSDHLNVDLEKLIECEQILTPNTLQSDTGAYKGSIYGMNQNTLAKIMSRKDNKDKLANELYYVGGTVHPGGGIPLALLSADNTSKQIQKKYL